MTPQDKLISLVMSLDIPSGTPDADTVEQILARLRDSKVELWKHIKTGGLYEEVGLGELQTTEPIKDMTAVVIYRGQDGGLWVRPVEEFHDGRFSKVV